MRGLPREQQRGVAGGAAVATRGRALNGAKLGSSPRLRRVLDVLERSGGWLTTRQIQRRAAVCAVSTAVSELRHNRCRIACEMRVDAKGRRRWRYRLEAAPEGWRAQ